jgi:hypothetical protein
MKRYSPQRTHRTQSADDDGCHTDERSDEVSQPSGRIRFFACAALRLRMTGFYPFFRRLKSASGRFKPAKAGFRAVSLRER